ncbi:MAG: 30S ribosomal protein S13 [Candidatus Omnitrophica bacterium]|nr:30S ribosomal protein S13 [Candidatus Omnitrophota bacterium]
MPRILGIDLPKEKRIEAALPYLYGIGLSRSKIILSQAQVNADKRAKDLTEEEISRITHIIQKNYVTEGDLRREINENVRRHMEIGTYRGLRHRKGLPVRGQRTKTNARTRKGKKPVVGHIIKKETPPPAATKAK